MPRIVIKKPISHILIVFGIFKKFGIEKRTSRLVSTQGLPSYVDSLGV